MNNNIYFVSLGCSKNLVDSEILMGGLKSQDYKIVKDLKLSDTIIINTCGFLDVAREESVDTILECSDLKKQGVVKQLIVMGCFSSRYKDDLVKEIPEVDAFFGTSDHSEILSFITGKDFKKDDPDYFRSLLTPKHYAYLKIAEGCDNVCSFCSIPLMRGLQRSNTLEQNVLEANNLANRGVKELLLIAQDSTTYGRDLNPKSSLYELVEVLDKVNDIEWIRLHYAHPAHLSRKMIKKFSELKKLIPYIDMPTQHGSDKMLKDMKRGLNSAGIKNRIDLLRKTNENIAIRTSVIVGFPNETEKDFNNLVNFVEETQFDRLGVFKYSEEEGTSAAVDFKDNIPKNIKEERYEVIMKIQQKINLSKNKQRINKKEKIIIDVSNEDGWSLGRSFMDAPEIDNYVKINQKLDVGKFYDILITDAYEYDVVGELID
ncbi:MAG: 30S ribosomal protein S12 methylthiotransferase RimO [Candidatus Marinimicrobia bacterium]|nr:30S ribosomal protein S12 methylthiotransferase RimO [Candidatus Neomarinimicrobiota bacterium]|tara:strand:- start:163 stop:1455 length:1293 start_codon:yes stop_codon:yes gene_type:complete